MGYSTNSRSYQVFLNKPQLMMPRLIIVCVGDDMRLQNDIKMKIQKTFVAAEAFEEAMVVCLVHDRSYEWPPSPGTRMTKS